MDQRLMRKLCLLVGVMLVLPAWSHPLRASTDTAPVERHVQTTPVGYAQTGRLSTDGERHERIRRVGTQLLATAAAFCSTANGDCLPQIVIENGRGLNAHAEAGRISVSRPLIDLAQTDDQLAMVIAHEMGHLLLGHTDPAAMSLDEDSAREEELHADYVGVYLVARAGFQPRAAVELWPNLIAAQPQLLGGGKLHPGVGERYRALKSACREIEAKQRAGAPLVPGS